MRVLIADDSRVMRQIVVRTLRQAGFEWEVVEAEDGQQALAYATSQPFDLILSDWNMPNMLGIEMLQQLRALGNQTPVGFVTSEGSQQMRDIAANSGASFLIAKPFDASTFQQILGPFNR